MALSTAPTILPRQSPPFASLGGATDAAASVRHGGKKILSPVNQKLYPTENPIFFNRADAAASAAPPSEALGGLCRGSIVAAVESAIFRVQIDQLPGHSRTRFIFFSNRSRLS